MVIKLLMNSMYGNTTIIQPIETDTVVKDNHIYIIFVEKYMSYNYNCIESVLKVDDRYYI